MMNELPICERICINPETIVNIKLLGGLNEKKTVKLRKERVEEIIHCPFRERWECKYGLQFYDWLDIYCKR